MKCRTCRDAGFVKVYVWTTGQQAYNGPIAWADDKTRWLTDNTGYRLAYCPDCNTAATRHTHQEAA